MRLLLVEDDQMLGASLKKALEKNGYGVDWEQDGEAALLCLDSSGFSAVLLDINLPGISGLEVLKRLRARKDNVPVLALTARDTLAQKIEGLDLGADDYVVKPFDLDELFARLRSLVRRSAGRAEPTLRCPGGVEINLAARTVHRDGASVTVTANEFRVLAMLAERMGRFVAKSDIEYALYDADGGVESNTVEVTVYRLRRKLGNGLIRTIRGVGYMVPA
jgi:DNA-binding response OmpR family regulator